MVDGQPWPTPRSACRRTEFGAQRHAPRSHAVLIAHLVQTIGKVTRQLGVHLGRWLRRNFVRRGVHEEMLEVADHVRPGFANSGDPRLGLLIEGNRRPAWSRDLGVLGARFLHVRHGSPSDHRFPNRVQVLVTRTALRGESAVEGREHLCLGVRKGTVGCGCIRDERASGEGEQGLESGQQHPAVCWIKNDEGDVLLTDDGTPQTQLVGEVIATPERRSPRCTRGGGKGLRQPIGIGQRQFVLNRLLPTGGEDCGEGAQSEYDVDVAAECIDEFGHASRTDARECLAAHHDPFGRG